MPGHGGRSGRSGGAHTGRGDSAASSAAPHSLLARGGKREKRQQARPTDSELHTGLNRKHGGSDPSSPLVYQISARKTLGSESHTLFFFLPQKGDVCSSTCQTVTTCGSQDNLFLPSPSSEPGSVPKRKYARQRTNMGLDLRSWTLTEKLYV